MINLGVTVRSLADSPAVLLKEPPLPPSESNQVAWKKSVWFVFGRIHNIEP